eukprot:CAMPEP_0118886208 /NCGR_PEP_ID=MMETSP1163-20130328/24383_1 /TAXON_ID=124430 /ORGANISM="Phaeomonas parva, Strain CCMP2877" /LENGTH=170 /DNA_ID=CAMNT_0006824377 /DNA_START=32 /DNA_END=545 /DNA_ORIENTATION=+
MLRAHFLSLAAAAAAGRRGRHGVHATGFLPLRRRLGHDGERVDGAVQLLRERVVHEAVPLQQPHAVELLRHHHNFEVTLAARRHVVPAALIQHRMNDGVSASVSFASMACCTGPASAPAAASSPVVAMLRSPANTGPRHARASLRTAAAAAADRRNSARPGPASMTTAQV